MAQRHTLSIFVIGAMLAGIAVGLACNLFLDGTQVELAVAVFSTLTDIFLRLIKLVVAPLVFATLVAGIAHMGDAAAVGRIGAKTMAWFIFASLVSLALGLVLVDLIAPAVGISLPRTDETTVATGMDTSGLCVRQFIVQMVPSSIVAAMANNEILQIVVFSVLLGTAAVALGERAALLLLLAAWLAVGRRTARLLAAIRTPVMIGFATASSEATYPRTLQALEGFGLPTRIVRFVLPLGYSFNLDGSMLYCAFAVMFVLAVDQLLDMGRTATNVVGNSVAAVIVSRWEQGRETAGAMLQRQEMSGDASSRHLPC